MCSISPEQRQAIAEHGTPLRLIDAVTNETYMLLPVEFLLDKELGSCTARVPSIPAYGEGETEEEASLALMAALNGYIDTFGDSGDGQARR